MCVNWARLSVGRRSIFGAGAALLATSVGAVARAQGTATSAMPAAALQALVEGNARYAAGQPRE